jgi:hypothetical protein
MLKIFRPTAGIGCVLVLLSASFAMGQLAPRPAQILEAKKVFISNASGESYDLFFSAPDQPYEQFYTAAKSLGRYELVTSPAEADLVLEIHFVPARTTEEAHLELVVVDPKTRITLWTIIERVGTAARQSTGRKNFEKAMSLLVQDLAKLAAPASAASGATANQ